MRVLHLNTVLTGGGTDEHCVSLVKALVRLGVDASLAGIDGRMYSERAREWGLRFHPLPSGKVGLISATAQILRREKVDILHAHHGRDFWPGVIARKLSGGATKLVITRHLASAPGSRMSRWFLMNRCAALIAVSGFVHRVLQQGEQDLGSQHHEGRKRGRLMGDTSRISVVHNGVDTSLFRPFEAAQTRQEWGLKPEHYAFGVVGSYDFPHGKGQREFLRAAATIHATVPHARFLIVGRGNMERELQGDIARLGISGKAWLTPYSLNMPAAMNALDCLVHPTTEADAFGLVLLEAFACGKPVIASRLGGVPEAFAAGSYGQLVEPGAIAPLAQAMLRQIGAPALSLQEKHRLHEGVAKDFSVEQMAGKVFRIYARLLHTGATPENDYIPERAATDVALCPATPVCSGPDHRPEGLQAP